MNYNIYVLISLYLFNLLKNLSDYDKVFLINKDHQMNCTQHTAYIIKFFILTLFQIMIIYLLFNNSDYEAKPLILISYGIALPLYTIEYMNKIYDHDLTTTDKVKEVSLFILQCLTSTLAIYLIWSKKSIVSALALIFLTSLIMILPLFILKYNVTCNIDKKPKITNKINEVQKEVKDKKESVKKDSNNDNKHPEKC